MHGTVSPASFFVASLKRFTNSPMFTPCWPSAGPTGGAGVACPPGHWSLTLTITSFLGGIAHLDLFNLPVFEVHPGRPAEDRDRDSDQALLGVDLLHDPVEVLERAFLDA